MLSNYKYHVFLAKIADIGNYAYMFRTIILVRNHSNPDLLRVLQKVMETLLENSVFFRINLLVLDPSHQSTNAINIAKTL